jgi:hypothetical protein
MPDRLAIKFAILTSHQYGLWDKIIIIIRFNSTFQHPNLISETAIIKYQQYQINKHGKGKWEFWRNKQMSTRARAKHSITTTIIIIISINNNNYYCYYYFLWLCRLVVCSVGKCTVFYSGCNRFTSRPKRWVPKMFLAGIGKGPQTNPTFQFYSLILSKRLALCVLNYWQYSKINNRSA